MSTTRWGGARARCRGTGGIHIQVGTVHSRRASLNREVVQEPTRGHRGRGGEPEGTFSCELQPGGSRFSQGRAMQNEGLGGSNRPERIPVEIWVQSGTVTICVHTLPPLLNRKLHQDWDCIPRVPTGIFLTSGQKKGGG